MPIQYNPKKQCFDFPKSKLHKLGVFWISQDVLLMMGTEIFDIDASWAEKLTKKTTCTSYKHILIVALPFTLQEIMKTL